MNSMKVVFNVGACILYTCCIDVATLGIILVDEWNDLESTHSDNNASSHSPWALLHRPLLSRWKLTGGCAFF